MRFYEGYMAVLMGIDYGTKRIGIALTDQNGTMAFPFEVLEHDSTVISNIKRIVQERGVKKIVIGLPLDLAGEPTDATAGSRTFAKTLNSELGIPVDFADEIYTSQQAARIQGKKESIDASSAALILDQYLRRPGFMQKKLP